MSEQNELATFAGGCFWCTEAVFQRLRGVQRVVSGYIGGQTDEPTYEQVCGGRTGHAEAVEIEFDPEQITYEQLLEVFFHTHDPTTLNRQGNDRGTQYRSAIFYHSAAQENAARTMIDRLQASGEFLEPIVTTVSAATRFYPAEGYHQNYYNDNPSNGYCSFVVREKVVKAQRKYADLMTSESSAS